MMDIEPEKHTIVEMDQLRVLLRTLNHRFGSEVLLREVRSILAESKDGSRQLAEADRADLMSESGVEEGEDSAAQEPRKQKSLSAWENAVRAASQESSAPARAGARDGQSQGKLAAARRALGG